MENKFGFNPWFKIFTKPRMTIRAIVEYNPNFRLFVLAAIYGMCAFFGLAQNMGLGSHKNFVVFLPLLILAPLWGYMVFSVGAFFVFIIGKLLKGQADFKQVRLAYAWSNVPLIINAVLWLFLFFIFGSDLFSPAHLQAALSAKTYWILMLAVLAQLVFSIWGIVIYVIALSEVQRFSILRTLVNLILGLAVFLAIVFAISFVWLKLASVSIAV